MSENVKEPEVLLVEEKGSKQLKAVTGLNPDGTPKTTLPQQSHETEFMKVNQHADVLENFMSNFLSQCKNPTHFQFFKIPAIDIEKMVMVLQEYMNEPENIYNKALLDEHRVDPEELAAKQAAKKEYQPIDESKINWDELSQIGITKELLVESNSLEKMLNYQKSPVLLPIQVEIMGAAIKSEARLSLRQNEQGEVSLAVHPVRKELELEGLFYGNPLSEQVKESLRQSGHAGELVDIKVNNDNVKTFVSVDKLTNELIAVRADKIKLPETIKGVTLNEEQKQALSEGKSIFVEGMTSKKGQEFSAYIQVNADKKGLEFRFDNNQNQSQTNEFHIPSKLKDVELSEQQQNDLKERKTIYVEGMIDDKGETFNAYVRVNDEKSKLDFSRNNPESKENVIPDNNSKTQVAVNSEGKTNEATKDVKEPLKQGQTQPSENQNQSENKKAVKKPGMKM